MKCVVSGGAGFIGSHLVDALINQGHEVVIIDNLNGGKKENINTKATFFELDIARDDLSSAFKGAQALFHVAAIPRVQYSIKFPKESNEANITGTLNILEAARIAGISRIIYSASSSAYGNQDSLPLVESMSPNPLSPYALQKLTGEYYCKLYTLIHGIPTISLRYFNVYGPRQDPSGGYACLIPNTINLALEGSAPQIFGDGEQTRDFTYVKDVVAANIAALSAPKDAFGEVFNVGNGKNISVNTVVKTILAIANPAVTPQYKPPVIEPRDTLADISKSKSLLGWEPKHSFNEAIKETIDWFKTR